MLHQVLSPKESDAGIWVHQNAWFNMGTFNKGSHEVYSVKRTPEWRVFICN